MNIIEISPKENFILYIKVDDGREDLFDVKPYLDSEVFVSLKNKDEFKKIYNGGYFIEWDCGADLSADTIVLQQSARAEWLKSELPVKTIRKNIFHTKMRGRDKKIETINAILALIELR